MKIASFDGGRIGVIIGEEIIEISAGDAEAQWPPVAMLRFIARFEEEGERLHAAIADGPRRQLTDVRLETPVAWPNKVIAYPANYHAHIEEMGDNLVSTFKSGGQGFFLKANSSLSGPSDPIVLPAIPDREIHHECELAIIIGKGGRNIARTDALSHIFGYSCLLDIVIRGKEERVMRKSFDSFCPVGPWIVTADEIDNPADIDLELTVNGDLRQKANTGALIVDIPDMIAIASSVMTLFPGDIIASGTPAGVGPIEDGDELRIRIAHVGEMSLSVRRGEGGDHQIWNKPVA
ncbi:MAG: fumarylacetoacetate hydrolase family protein [Sphingobium sp.]|nr:fumarylacetoacetate hydrolase family protein [Sphingobium sp.]